MPSWPCEGLEGSFLAVPLSGRPSSAARSMLASTSALCAVDAALSQQWRCAKCISQQSQRRRRTVTQCRRHHRHGTGLLMAHNYTAPVAIGSACAWIFGRLGPHLLYCCSLERVGGCLVNVKLVKSRSTTCFERALYLF